MSTHASNVPRPEWPEGSLWCFDWEHARYALFPAESGEGQNGSEYEVRRLTSSGWWPTTGLADMIALEHAIGMLIDERPAFSEVDCHHCGGGFEIETCELDFGPHFCCELCEYQDSQGYAESEAASC